MRKLGHIARKFDRGYGHFTTRQNIQYNWIELEQSPEILAELASVEMHAIQTSGNCIRNITSDQFCGVAADELADPRPYIEILRQWSTFHPEFAWLPRKFKIAVNAAAEDRAAVQVHDIGLNLIKNDAGELGFQVLVGGGLGRTPIIGSVIREFLPWQHLLSYTEAIMRVYNQYGRRDNKYKARIKILVKALGVEEFARQVEAEWLDLKDSPSTITAEELARVASYFTPPAYETLKDDDVLLQQQRGEDKAFSNWLTRNVRPHKVSGYAIVTLSLKKTGTPPGDATAEQIDFVAELSDRYSFGELRVTHEQNLVLADVKQSDLLALYKEAKTHGLATANIGLLTDIICCPGGDFCSLANAKSIPIAEAIAERFDNVDFQHDIGDIELNISGCINACGHHHVGNIGILGVDKDGSEWYQVSIGGAQGNTSAIGKIIGPSFAAGQMPEVIGRLLEVYVTRAHRGRAVYRYRQPCRRQSIQGPCVRNTDCWPNLPSRRRCVCVRSSKTRLSLMTTGVCSS
jgi:sulfite reductase (NADPH) hemoprotein beta-component